MATRSTVVRVVAPRRAMEKNTTHRARARGRRCAVARASGSADDSDDVIEASVETSDAVVAVAEAAVETVEAVSEEVTYELRQRTTPKRFAVGDGQLLDVVTASGGIALRTVSGLLVDGYRVSVENGEVPEGQYSVFSGAGRHVVETSDAAKFPRPEKPVKIFQFQGCPFCKKTREAVVALDLDVEFYPCPKDGPEYRPYVRETGGKAQFPYLVDENTTPPTTMYESDEIIQYLYEKYGPGKANISPLLTSGALTSVTAGFSLLPRLGRGSAYVPSKKPENMKPIVFYAYEASPFCVLVAEKLCELELPYLQRSCGRGSPKRQELFDKRGMFQVPYIEDPNTGVAMFESGDILAYLQETYAA